MRRSTTTVLGLVATVSLLSSCGAGGADAGAQPAPDSSNAGKTGTVPAESPSAQPQDPTTSPTSDVAGTAATRFPSDHGEQFAKHKGAWDLVLRDIRVGEHDGFDRLVAEFKGAGTPGWNVKYVTRPRADGSVAPVDVQGDSFLGVPSPE